MNVHNIGHHHRLRDKNRSSVESSQASQAIHLFEVAEIVEKMQPKDRTREKCKPDTHLTPSLVPARDC